MTDDRVGQLLLQESERLSSGVVPPPLPLTLVSPRGASRRAALTAAGVAAAVVTTVVVVRPLAGTSDQTRSVTATPASAPAGTTCGSTLPLDLEVPGASAGPLQGAAPGSAPAESGQLVQHWVRPEGPVEIRWPAPVQELYAPAGSTAAPALPVGTMHSRAQMAVEVRPSADFTAERSTTPDAVLRPGSPATAAPSASCDTVLLTIETPEGRWSSGVRLPRAVGSGFELVDRQPRIVERRAVDVAPAQVVDCERTDGGTNPSRSGTGVGTEHRPQPADVLLDYVERTPGAASSGYVEMTAPDGTVTYGMPFQRSGWTTLLSVRRAAQGWHLTHWLASGC